MKSFAEEIFMGTKITAKEAATLLSISVQRVRSLCRTQKLPAVKFAGSWMIDKDAVESMGQKIGTLIPENYIQHFEKNNSNKPIALSFFTGAMGLDIGVEKAGFKVCLACEIDKNCKQTIRLNKPEVTLIDDIANYSAEDILNVTRLTNNDDIDLIIGGPPCQAFSTAGKRQAFHDNRGNVFLKYIDLALELQPKYFVIENVRGLLSCPLQHRPLNERGTGFPDLKADEMKGGALNFILNKIKRAGYGYSFNLYNSANFGAPQTRERVIIVCSRDGNPPPYIMPTHSEKGEFGLPKWKTFREAVEGLEEHHHLNFPEKRLKYYRLLQPGQNWKSLPKELQKEALGKSFYSGGGKTGFLRRISWDKPSPTLVTHPAMPATDLAHPVENRPLSIEEYKRLQGFPDEWKLAGSLMQQYSQVGNAVPIQLGFAVGKLIINLLNNQSPIPFENFQFSRYKNTNEVEWEEQFWAQYNKKSGNNL